MVVPIDLRTLILITTLLAAVLSGCISAKEDDPDLADDPAAKAEAEAAAQADAEPPVPQVKGLHDVDWVGQRVLDERFSVPEGYDHVATHFSNTGQLIGHPVLEAGDGSQMDDAFTSVTAGVFHLGRLMPAEPGSAHLTMDAGPALDGAVLGVGGFTAVAFADTVPRELLDFGWIGERVEPAVLETDIRFYVPGNVERFMFRLSGTGQTMLGFELRDPDGNTMLTYGPNSGPQSDTHELEGAEGLWTLSLEGMTNGSWSLTAETVEPEPTSFEDALKRA